MLKKFTVLSFSILFFISCGNTARQTTNGEVSAPKTADDSLVVSGHSQTNALNGAPQNSAVVVPKSETKTKWKQDGTPIDTSEFDGEITRAQKDLKAKPNDAAAKKNLAEAYLKRAVALTEARQYASSLGDYRRVLKYDAENEEAKKWIETTMNIYNGMNKQSPNEGEEPPPLPFERKN